MREGLVEQQQAGIHDEGARQRQPLLLPSGQGRRSGAALAGQSAQGEHLLDAFEAFFARNLLGLQHKMQVFFDRHVRP